MKNDLSGKWAAASPAIAKLVLDAGGTCSIDGRPGRWQVMEDDIWLLDDSTRAGTKWRFSLSGGDTLVLSHPEDFKYLGGKEYLYFQMTPPSTVVLLTRASLRENGPSLLPMS